MTVATRIDAAIAECDLVPGAEEARAHLIWAKYLLQEPVALTLKRLGVHAPHNVQFSPVAIVGRELWHVFNGRRKYNLDTGAMTNVPFTNSDGTPPVVNPENFDMCAVDGRIFQGSGAPAGKFGVFDPTGAVYTNLSGSISGRSGLIHDEVHGQIFAVGGSSWGGVTRSYPLPYGPWASDPRGNAPILTKDYSKCTNVRSGGKDGFVGLFGDYNALYESPADGAPWVLRDYTGAQPPDYTLWEYWPNGDAYIGWCNSNVAAGGTAAKPVQKFYLLRRSTMACQELPVTLPTVKVKSFAGNAMAITGNELALIVDDETTLFMLDLSGL